MFFNENIRRIIIFFLSIFLFVIYIYINEKGNKIIAVVFAGRKHYLELLMIYLEYLKENKKIDEIHFWQFTNNKHDMEYLESISNLHKTSGTFLDYRNIYPKIKKKGFFINVKSSNGIRGSLLINDKYELIIESIIDFLIVNYTFKSLITSL